jgi:GAF domain-containing protein
MNVPGAGGHLPPEPRRALEALARDIATVADVPVVAIWSADEGTRTLSVAAVGGQDAGSLPLVTLPYGIGGIGWVVANRQALDVADVFADSRFVGLDWRRSHRLTSFYGVPLVLDERLLGVLALDARAPIELTAPQRERLAEVAARAARALDDASREAEAHRRYEELAANRAQLAARVREMAALIAVGEVVGTTTDPVEALRLICRELGRFTGADTVAAYRLDRGRNELFPVAGYHVPASARATLAGARLSLGEVRFGNSLFVEQQVVWSDDALHDPRFANSFFARFPHQSCALIPLRVDDEMSGVLHLVWWTRSRRLDEHEVALLQAIGHQASVVLRNARLLGLHAVTRLANAAAHEINNPLAIIVGQLQLLARETQSTGRRRLDFALAAADRIRDIVSRLTRITRLKDLEDHLDLPPALDLRRSSEADDAPGAAPVPPGDR